MNPRTILAPLILSANILALTGCAGSLVDSGQGALGTSTSAADVVQSAQPIG